MAKNSGNRLVMVALVGAGAYMLLKITQKRAAVTAKPMSAPAMAQKTGSLQYPVNELLGLVTSAFKTAPAQRTPDQSAFASWWGDYSQDYAQTAATYTPSNIGGNDVQSYLESGGVIADTGLGFQI